MSFDDFRLIYVLACFGLGLIILSPTLAMVVRLPGGEKFSELWILGSEGMAEDYPFNVKADEPYTVYLGIGNHMGSLEYYRVYVKLRNQTEPVPSAVNGTPSTLEPLLEYRTFLSDNETWEKEILFSFEDVSFDRNVSKVSKLVINDCSFKIDKVAMWDEERHGFYYQLFFELWLYNATASGFQFHNRFVWIWLNVTESF